MSSHSGQKRARSGEEEEGEEEPLLKLRRTVCAENPNYSCDAARAVRLIFGPPAALRSKPPHVWEPDFVHQLFPGELMFGFRDPLLCVYYSDPQLDMAVAGVASGVTGAVLAEDPRTKACTRVAPDDANTILDDALPPGLPKGESFSLQLGPTLGAALRAAHLALPPPLRLFPGETGGGGGKGGAHPLADPHFWRPPGPAVHTYTGGDGLVYAIHRWRVASSPATRAYHERMQTLAVWHIETASPIDTSDVGWVVYVTYRVGQGGDGAYAFVGYMTVFRFTNPLRERPDTLRLAQLLLLPPFQRCGHGKALLHALHVDARRGGRAHAAEGGEGGDGEGADPDPDPASHPCGGLPELPGGRVLDVTVEAPCHGMTALRDGYDVGRAYRTRAFAFLPGWDSFGPGEAGGGGAASTPPRSLIVDRSAGELEPARAALQVTPLQVVKAYHALLFARIDRTDVEARRALRLLIKRHLLRSDQDVGALRGEALKEVLEDRHAEYEAGMAGAGARRGVGLVSKEEAGAAAAAWAARQASIEATHTRADP